MVSVGQLFREKRERQKLSLEEVSAKTRISLKQLHAIENDDASSFQSPFFYKSFVKQYAAMVGISYSWLEPNVKAFAQTIPEPALPGEEELTQAANVRPQRGVAKGSSRWLMPTFWLGAVVVVCSGLYAVMDKDKKEFPQPSATSKQMMDAKALEKQRPSLPGESILLKIAALEKTRVSMDADGQRVYDGLLDADSTKTLEGHETAKLRTENAGGLTVIFNGKNLGALGQRGQARTVLFTRNEYEILQSSLTSKVQLLRFASFGFSE